MLFIFVSSHFLKAFINLIIFYSFTWEYKLYIVLLSVWIFLLQLKCVLLEDRSMLVVARGNNHSFDPYGLLQKPPLNPLFLSPIPTSKMVGGRVKSWFWRKPHNKPKELLFSLATTNINRHKVAGRACFNCSKTVDFDYI